MYMTPEGIREKFPDAFIERDVQIGSDVRIGSGAVIGRGACIGRNRKGVTHTLVIKASVKPDE